MDDGDKNETNLLHLLVAPVADGSSRLVAIVRAVVTPIGIELIMLSTCCDWFETRGLVPSAPNVGHSTRSGDELNIFTLHTQSLSSPHPPFEARHGNQTAVVETRRV